MNEIERLKTIQSIRNKMIDVYDECRFNSDHIKYDIFSAVKSAKADLDEIADSYISDMSNVQKIIVMEDVIIEPGQTCELVTNVTFEKMNEEEIEINFEGYVPTSGYLKLVSKYSDVGLRIYVKNVVPKMEVDDKSGYHYCNPDSTRYFWAGVYKIEKGTVIGIMITKNKEHDIKNQYQLIHNRFNKVN